MAEKKKGFIPGYDIEYAIIDEIKDWPDEVAENLNYEPVCKIISGEWPSNQESPEYMENYMSQPLLPMEFEPLESMTTRMAKEKLDRLFPWGAPALRNSEDNTPDDAA